MKPNTIFIPHEITDEGSLPKVFGRYGVINKAHLITNALMDLTELTKDNWREYYDYWLEEKEVPTSINALIQHL